MTQDIRRRIHDIIAARHDEQCAFLAKLVKIPSDNPPGDCAAHGRHAAEALEGLGFTVERNPVPDQLVQDNGMISATNLVVRQRFAEGPVIALNAHGDVVPPGEGWSVDPYGAEIRDGMMYGRGVAVSKSDFATYGFALLALMDSGAKLAGTVELHFTYDEETGGAIGPQWLLDEGISRPDYALSAGFSYGVVTHHNGCLHLEVEISGKSAHAARPDTGHDALEAATTVLAALYSERETYADIHSEIDGIDTPSLVVGLIEGGINTNVVPDGVRFRLDRRIIPEEDAGAVEDRLRSVINDAVAGHHGITCQVRRIMLATPFQPIPGGEAMVEALARNAEAVLGEPIAAHGVPLYTDARLYANASVPTAIYGAGPHSLLEANGHRADEKLRLDDLLAATEVVALTLLDLLHDAPS
ncbi:MAG: M20/M25/M40 family metallo-hydrolase [Alphaproteobacteria bacterium]